MAGEERTLQAAHMERPGLGIRSDGPWACLSLKSLVSTHTRETDTTLQNALTVGEIDVLSSTAFSTIIYLHNNTCGKNVVCNEIILNNVGYHKSVCRHSMGEGHMR